MIRVSSVRRARHPRGAARRSPLFAGAELRLSLRRHRRHRALDRAADGVHVRQRDGDGPRARGGARRRRPQVRLRGLVVLLRDRHRAADDRAGAHPPEYPYALSKYQGEQAVLHWGQVYRLPVVSIRIFNAYGPRSKTTGAYGAVFGVFLAQKLNGQAVHGRRRRHAAARFRLRHRSGARVSGRGRVGADAGDLQRRRRQSAVGQPARGAARRRGRSTCPKRPGEPDCTWADITKIRERARLEAGGHVRGRASREMLRQHRLLARGAGVGSGVHRAGDEDVVRDAVGRDAMMFSGHDGTDARYRRKIKTRDELRDDHRRRPRARKVIMCHGTFDLVHPGHLRHLMYAQRQGRHPGREPHLATRTSRKANYRPFVPQQLRAMNLAALEVVDYVIVDEQPTPLENLAYPAARLSSPRATSTSTDRRHPPQDAAGDRRPRHLRRRDHLHARRRRLFVVAVHRDRRRRRSRSRSCWR